MDTTYVATWLAGGGPRRGAETGATIKDIGGLCSLNDGLQCPPEICSCLWPTPCLSRLRQRNFLCGAEAVEAAVEQGLRLVLEVSPYEDVCVTHDEAVAAHATRSAAWTSTWTAQRERLRRACKAERHNCGERDEQSWRGSLSVLVSTLSYHAQPKENQERKKKNVDEVP